MKKLTLLSMLVGSAFVGNAYAQSEFDFSKATGYHLIYLDGETVTQIPAADIVKDYRVDDTVHFLYIWDNTYTANPAIGPNANGVPGEFLDFTVGNAGWSGMGFAGVAPGKDMTGITDAHYLHVSFKTTDSDNHILIVSGADGKEAKLNFGDKPFNDNGAIYEVYDNFTRDGEWYSFDIPVTTLKRMGTEYTGKNLLGNAVALLSGGRTGANICMDALYYYQKKTEAGIAGTAADEVKITVDGQFIRVSGDNGICVFSPTGHQVATSSQAELAIDGLPKGLYLVKSGNKVEKILIK